MIIATYKLLYHAFKTFVIVALQNMMSDYVTPKCFLDVIYHRKPISHSMIINTFHNLKFFARKCIAIKIILTYDTSWSLNLELYEDRIHPLPLLHVSKNVILQWCNMSHDLKIETWNKINLSQNFINLKCLCCKFQKLHNAICHIEYFLVLKCHGFPKKKIMKLQNFQSFNSKNHRLLHPFITSFKKFKIWCVTLNKFWMQNVNN